MQDVLACPRATNSISAIFVLEVISGCLVAAALPTSLFLVGGTPEGRAAILFSLSLLAALTWGASRVIGRRGLRSPGLAAVAVALLILGWLMTVNAVSVYERSDGFTSIEQPLAWLPIGASDPTSARISMLSLSAALLLAMVASDLASDWRWARRWMIVAWASGVVVVLLGLAQKADFVESLFHHRHEDSPFGVFSFHGYAGSYLLMLLPWAIAAVALPGPVVMRVAALIGAALVVIALWVNLSDAAQLIGGGIGVAVILALVFRGRWRWPVRPILFPAMLAGMTVAVVATLFFPGPLMRQLEQWFPHDGVRARFLMWRSAEGLVGEAGWLGLGPGAFKLAVPDSPSFDRMLYRHWIVTPHTPGTEVSYWSHACNDYLQALIEWGRVGTGLVAIAVIGAVIASGRILMRPTLPFDWPTLLRAATFFSLTAIWLHAAVDSPLQVVAIQLHLGVLVGVAWVSRHWDHRQPSNVDSNEPCASS